MGIESKGDQFQIEKTDGTLRDKHQNYASEDREYLGPGRGMEQDTQCTLEWEFTRSYSKD